MSIEMNGENSGEMNGKNDFEDSSTAMTSSESGKDGPEESLCRSSGEEQCLERREEAEMSDTGMVATTQSPQHGICAASTGAETDVNRREEGTICEGDLVNGGVLLACFGHQRNPDVSQLHVRFYNFLPKCSEK
ncbi:MAG: hypothetical protein GY861_20135 [bacterium]|nr:hypothetical protein [bacterium]